MTHKAKRFIPHGELAPCPLCQSPASPYGFTHTTCSKSTCTLGRTRVPNDEWNARAEALMPKR